MTASHYRIPESKVAHELMDGEVIVIHFATGCYFSLNGSAASIWQWIAAGATRQQIVDSFEAINDDQAREVDAFLEQLAADGILEKSADPAPATSFSAAPVPYRKPVIDSYNDMRNLLLVDPIHEVDETGWPKPLEG
jgi:hypothetical protein